MQTETSNHTQRQLMSGPRLLVELFDEASRPSLRWLRTQQRAKAVPSVRIGHLVFFDPAAVRQSLERRNTVRAKGVA